MEDMERELLELNGNNERLARSHAELLELQLLLERAGERGRQGWGGRGGPGW